MFCSTFYSYKGGVGRTLALANVAVATAKRRKRVLVVDFDLEAPGLTTMEPFRAASSKAGLIEFVRVYCDTGSAPAASEYIHTCVISDSVAEEGEALTVDVMPAGKEADYPDQFSAVDWSRLYDEQNGFLLMEDLRAQWSALNYDYVFIDSRTGLTDVGGICTRQLPDLNVVVFFPNEQNLAGLKQVAAQIRVSSAREQAIQLLFVASRLPRLDDEDDVLRGWLDRFRAELAYSDEQLCKIEHYDSLALLDQELFVLTRAKSGLAKQYFALSDMIARSNFDDADGALEVINESWKPRSANQSLYAFSEFTPERREVLDTIARKHIRDYVIQHALAESYWLNDQTEKGLAAVQSGLASLGQTSVTRPANPQIATRLNQLQLRLLREAKIVDPKLQLKSARAILNTDDASEGMIVDALAAIAEAEPTQLPHASELRESLLRDPKTALNIATRLEGSPETRPLGIELADTTVSADGVPELENDQLLGLITLLIGGGRFESAVSIASAMRESDPFYSVAKMFNLAMARWGLSQEPDEELFAGVLARAETVIDALDGANFNQCLALAHAVASNLPSMFSHLERAKQLVAETVQEFSCWTFSTVPRATFLLHLEEIEMFGRRLGPPPAVIVGAPEGARLI